MTLEVIDKNKSSLDICVCVYIYIYIFLDDSVVKNLATMQETQEMLVWSLGLEDLLEEEMATHSSNLT